MVNLTSAFLAPKVLVPGKDAKLKKAVAKLSIVARDAAGNATKRTQRITLIR